MSNTPSDGTGTFKSGPGSGSGIYKAQALAGSSSAGTTAGTQTDIRKIARALVGRRERGKITYRIIW